MIPPLKMHGVISLMVMLCGSTLANSDPLAAEFLRPPDTTKPCSYYYWISDNISKEGITKDLEATARSGIGETLVGNIFRDNQPTGRVKMLSESWWQLVEHAQLPSTGLDPKRTGKNSWSSYQSPATLWLRSPPTS